MISKIDLIITIKSFLNSVKDFFTGNKGNFTFALISVIVLNVIYSSFYFKLDLTKDHSYSLSSASVDAVSSLEDPMIIKIYFSKNLASPYNTVGRYVEDIVAEYADESNGNLEYEIHRMESKEDKEEAEAYGINPVQIMERGADQAKQSLAYMGIVILHGDVHEKINEITYIEGLEYKITSSISKIRSKVNAFAGIKDEMKITLYQSVNMSDFGIRDYSKINSAVSEIFEKINKDNRGRIKYSYSPVADDKTAEDLMAKFNIPGSRWKDVKTPDGKVIPSGTGVAGILVSLGNEFRVVQIPFAKTVFGLSVVLNNVEKDIRSAVDSLLSKNPVIGYVSGHGEVPLTDQNGELPFKTINSDLYNFTNISLANEIDSMLKTIVINSPKTAFSEEELFHLDQFIMKGGSVIFFIDSFNDAGNGMFIPVDTGLDGLLASYGFKINKDYVLDKNCYIARSRDMPEVPLNFVPFIERSSMSNESPVTKNLKRMAVAKVSSIEINDELMKKNAVKYDYILKSSDSAWTMKDNVELSPMRMQSPPKSELKSYNIAAIAEGKFESFFKNGLAFKSNDKAQFNQANELLAKAVSPARIALISSSEITTRNLVDANMNSAGALMNPEALFLYNNAVFIHNLTDYINGNDSYYSMRSKGMVYNPVDMKSGIFRAAAKIFNIAGIPLLIALLGIAAFIIRKKRASAISTKYSGGSIK
ncbi:MAG: Gldg family protein [Spirochaetes bacterium]|nr:Gldg family protein [Spirochaetota bacterium]